MPKLGMEPIRRDALVQAAIAEIGAARSLDVSVSKIAKRAGMSSGLAHHYFGSKDQIFLAAAREILRDYQATILAALKTAHTPRARVEAIIAGSFEDACFEPAAVTAWMQFYANSQSNPEVQNLMRIYHQRLRSNLVFDLRPLVNDKAADVAETLAAMIDGFYIRQSRTAGGLSNRHAVVLILRHLDHILRGTQ